MADRETVFTIEATLVTFGPGAVDDVGYEVARLGLHRVLVVADPALEATGALGRVLDRLTEAGVAHSVYDQIRVEPTVASMQAAADHAKGLDVDGIVALGGGSTIDHAKVANLLATHGGEILDYVNPPIGGGRTPPGPLMPLVAIPTTAGSGSEATTVAVLDIPDLQVKTGISHRTMRPAQAIVDPELSATAPASVIASAGLDVVCHAVESFLSVPYTERARPATPADRPPYQGSNPVADVWSARAIGFGGEFLRRAVAGGVEARGWMMLAATMAGVGFGSAGVHIPHACAYPIAGMRHEVQFEGYPSAFVPHGFSVIVTAPAAFRFTYDALPEKHHEAAHLLTGAPAEGPDALPDALLALMRDAGAPLDLETLGYTEADIPDLVAGAEKQQRLLVLAPKAPSAGDLADLFRQSMRRA
ncbi:hydroxyacid-oxoacid transhydrogenase [Rubrivirga marina]|uniref:hydroxyacid-oxoacid transhydrogenase n=1 Tax=Rubrivirga marina TaxID=1196024 RepID=A0A271IW99_9BACT|nr:hydroxyacid-oxoacid transhydrogenase [Rubrivirga marina]PAP74995.1 alcohol dehydrogenase [Rubrivirga marina]